jgi:hypothetical protein
MPKDSARQKDPATTGASTAPNRIATSRSRQGSRSEHSAPLTTISSAETDGPRILSDTALTQVKTNLADQFG